jgi:hypothetical protein
MFNYAYSSRVNFFIFNLSSSSRNLRMNTFTAHPQSWKNPIGPTWYFIGVAMVFLFDALGRSQVEQINVMVMIAVDSTIHSTLAFLIWLAISKYMCAELSTIKGLSMNAEMVLAYCAAAVVDVDHFLSAGSLSIFDATHLQTRKFLLFHNPLTIFVACSVIYYIFKHPRLALLTATSTLSHIARDATRTGILLFPIGVSPAIPYWLFLLFVCAVPYAGSLILKSISRKTPQIGDDVRVTSTEMIDILTRKTKSQENEQWRRINSI